MELKKARNFYCENIKKIIKIPLNSNLDHEGIIIMDTDKNLNFYPFHI